MLTNEFKYGDRFSSEFNIYCEQETHSILPAMRRCEQEIIGVDGVIDYGIGGYGTRIITLPLYYKGTFKSLRENREQIIAWLSGDGTAKRLILGRESGKYYKAKIYSEINLVNSSDRRIGEIEFECNPPWQYLLDGTILTPEQIIFTNCQSENGRFIKEFTENGSIRFANNGTQNVKPIIKIIGNVKSGITLTYGEQSFKLNTNVGFDGLQIDCLNETVTRMSGGNLFEYIDSTHNDFFELSPGNCEIALSETGIGVYPNSLTVIIQLEATVQG